jgi:threonine synthase
MYYCSTRDASLRVSAAEAIVKGISPDGGLYAPCFVPKLTMDEIAGLGNMGGYPERAAFVLSKYLTDFTPEETRLCAENAYGGGRFDSDGVIETKPLSDGVYLLELWHGPTCAFKDMALQILPRLLTLSAKKTKNDKEIIILTATSGDTGKAALDGFKDVPGTRVIVFYPYDGVSSAQRLQMVTQEGGNVSVCGVRGNFDDCQSAVKAIFTEPEINELLSENNMTFSSANSINWGRLAPQIAYYLSAYSSLLKSGDAAAGERFDVAVPTGNFGNILAAYYAREMGLPIGKLICASNRNNVLTDFLKTGVYNANREFHATLSPSMDILRASNLERLLFILSGGDDELIKSTYSKLAEEGAFEMPDSVKRKLAEIFYAGYADDVETKEAIKRVFVRHAAVVDPHTAVAVAVLERYKAEMGGDATTIIASTASPYKFAPGVVEAITGEPCEPDEFAAADRLFKLSKTPVPAPLAELKNKKIRFDKVVGRDELKAFVREELRL